MFFKGDSHMSADKPKHENIDQFEHLLGEPPLLKGEDKARYMKLRAAVEAELKPTTFFERLNVYDQTNKLWEEQRLRRYATALSEGAFMQALQSLLEPICKGTNEIAAQVALDYYSTDPKEKKSIMAHLVQYGITIEMIEAKAMQIAAAGLLTFDRMTLNRQTGRRLLRKELEQRSELQDNAVASPSVVPKQVPTS
jgi:hypothetical protein